MRNYSTVTLLLCSIIATAWLSVSIYENKLLRETHERIVLEYEKMLLEYEVDAVMNCNPIETETEERPYTYDMWITEKPCPEGKHGPLCHMNTGPEEQ